MKCSLLMRQSDTWPWYHTCWGHMILIGQVFKWAKFDILGLSYKLTSHDLWPSFVTFDLMNISRFLHYINKPSLVSNFNFFLNEANFAFEPILKLTSDDLWPWYMTFDSINIQRVPYCINISSLVSIRLHFSNEATFTFSGYLTTWPRAKC